jgi:Glycosyltransferase like family
VSAEAAIAGRPGPAGAGRREPVSIVTVFNDAEMRRACLDASVEAHRDEAPDVEYLPIDNSGGAFASAGAALNHGAASARHDYVVFVHQDVRLHSLAALEAAAGLLAEQEDIGLLGAIGVTAGGRFYGTVRDRVVLVGEPAAAPAAVDCVDELLFMVPRRVLELEPLPEDAELAWHAYAVEYGLRLRSRGLRVCAIDMGVTHNSLTVNLDRLDVAYEAVAAKHPDAMPVMTPQGQIGGPPQARDRLPRVLSSQRWRYRWLRESLDAHAARRAAGGSPCVLADIRLDVDELLARLPGDSPLHVVSHGAFADERPGPLALTRLGRPILLASAPLEAIAGLVGHGPALVTNLSLEDVRRLAPQLPAEDRILGFRASIGYWMLIGVPAGSLPAAWRERRVRPLGMRL